jgi:hypothetical protein
MQSPEVTQIPPETSEQVHTSVLLRKLINGAASKEHFNLNWLIGSLPNSSFGMIILFLAMLSMVPVITFVSRSLIMILTLQIILGYNIPVFPRWMLLRPLSSRYLARLDRHVVPALEHLEKAVRPRWPVFLQRARHITAIIVLLLTLLSLLFPLPFTNIPVALVILLMAFAYIEHDGLLLSITLITSLAMLMIALVGIIYVYRSLL